MNFLLKIVEGPNKGAEIALVEGVAVTFGKSDGCDIVLADATMPDEPLALEAKDGSVMAGRTNAPDDEMEPLEQFHVKTLGATSFAVGPADAPWGELVWPKSGGSDASRGDSEAQKDGAEEPVEEKKPEVGGDDPGDVATPQGKEKRGGCFGCLFVLLLLSLILVVLAWFFRDRLEETGYFDGIRDSRWTKKLVAVSRDGYARTSELIATWRASDIQPSDQRPSVSVSDVAARYGLSLSEEGEVVKISGNLKTRRERLAATAEAYSARPGVELDISDDESFRSSAEDALFTLTEGSLKVSTATNRFLVIAGNASSQSSLTKTLKSLNADVPRLRGVDVSRVSFLPVASAAGESADAPQKPGLSAPLRGKKKTAGTPVLPVCGILTMPYPCIITRDGRRYMEGAMLGGSVIQKINADSVVLTNSTGRLVWKP